MGRTTLFVLSFKNVKQQWYIKYTVKQGVNFDLENMKMYEYV